MLLNFLGHFGWFLADVEVRPVLVGQFIITAVGGINAWHAAVDVGNHAEGLKFTQDHIAENPDKRKEPDLDRLHLFEPGPIPVVKFSGIFGEDGETHTCDPDRVKKQ